jgi:hypothetical protein
MAFRTLFVVMRVHGPAWDELRALEEQPLWAEHAEFMDGLAERGFVVLGGLLGPGRAMLVCDAGDEREVRRTLAEDPWGEEMIETASIEPWTIRLDASEHRS